MSLSVGIVGLSKVVNSKRQITSEASGKIILSGEHSVVYGYPALLLPISLKAKCNLSGIKNNHVNSKVVISALDKTHEFGWEEINKAYLDHDSKLQLVLASLKTSFDYFGIKRKPGFKLELISSIPIGGFGSSTAVSAAIVRSVAKLADKSISPLKLWRLLVKIERLCGAKVSGADQYVISYESFIKYQKNHAPKRIKFKSRILKNFLIIQSGAPGCTTKDCIDFVFEQKKSNPKKVKDIFLNLTKEGKKMLVSLKKNDINGFFESVQNSGELLISLGVVSSNSVRLIRELEKLGGYLKLTGAGTVVNGGSGGILCFSKNYKKIESFLLKNHLDYLKITN